MIPEGYYGAGIVKIWDKGIFEPYDKTDHPGQHLDESFKKGHVTFILHGKKLKGAFTLIRLKKSSKKNEWLFFRKKL